MKHFFVAALVVTGMLLMSGSVQADLNDGLVAYYPFNGNANDESGNGNHGTEYGGVFYTTGKIGQAVKFQGEGYIRVSNQPSLALQTWSISVWAKKDELTDEFQALVSRHEKNDTDRYTYVTENYTVGTESDKITGGYEDCRDGNSNVKYNTGKISEWFHVVYTRSNINEEQSLYLNGERLIADLHDMSNHSPCNESNYVFDIGHGRVDRGHNYFEGLIDNVRIYNRVLSESEINQLYNEGNNGECYTQADIDDAVNHAIQECISDPASCGIEVNGDYQEGHSNGKEAVINNPSAYGLYESCDTCCTGSENININHELSFKLPNASYDAGPILGKMDIWANFIYFCRTKGETSLGT